MTKTATIIGAGVAGCTTAYVLAKHGIAVTLIERNTQIANAASGNPLAMLYPRLSGDELTSEFALTSYIHSLAFYQSLQLPESDFFACGMLQLGFNARELSRIKKVASKNHAPSLLKYLSPQQASSIAGIVIEHDALHFPTAAWINPKNLCERLTEHFNITVIRTQPVSHFTKLSQGFEVYNNERLLVTADILVIANANDAQQLLPNLPLQTKAVRGQISTLNASKLSQKISTIICSDGYLSPADSSTQTHCLGATFSEINAPATEQLNLTPTQQDHLENLNKLNNISTLLYQDLHDQITGGRVSYRCTTSDYWPLVGELIDSANLKNNPVRPNALSASLPWLCDLYINAAHGSKGFTSAPLCAELLASMINQAPLPMSNTLACMLNPNRFLLRELGLKQLAKTIASQQKISG